MIESGNDRTSFAKFIFQDKSAGYTREKDQLVRILSRSSTLPEVEGINIRFSTLKPDIFFIHPGRAISIGANFLSNPFEALLCLRYALEWQIWYKSQINQEFDPRICDLAACRVAAKFYKLTLPKNKIAINHIPGKIADIMLKFMSSDQTVSVLSESDFITLGLLHDQEYPKRKIDWDNLDILDPLANPLEYLLMSGGDLRLKIDPSRLLNKYGCRPFPRPKAFTFASSTATSISTVAFNQAERQRKLLIEESFKKGVFETASDFSKEIKSKLKKILGLSDSSSIIPAPSGTDISLQVAGISQAVFKKDIVHILVASDETGSGVPFALQGKHFSDRTAQASLVERGSIINGFREVEVKNIKLRNDKGYLKETADVEEEISVTIKGVFDSNKQPILHVMDQSKLGYSAPRDKCLKRLSNKFGDELLVLVDNSQLRMDQEDIKNYIKRGYLMTITGSKFFTGPPFNGALIVPENLSEKWVNVKDTLPEGLSEYFYRNEWPESWKLAKNLNQGINLGVTMRWFASLVEIERYFQIPLSLRYLGLEMFCNHVAKQIEQSAFLEHLSDFDNNVNKSSKFHTIKDKRTIFPFFVKLDQRVLNKSEIQKLYHLLNRDLSSSFDFDTDESRRLASQTCHIGQPVDVIYKNGKPSGVVRISLGSRVISKSWKEQDAGIFFQKIEEQMNQVDIIIRKIELILNYPECLNE